MSLSIRRNIKKTLVRFVTKYIVWDFDGTLYENQRLADFIENQYLLQFIKLTGKKITLSKFRILSKKAGSWSSLLSRVTKKSETEVIASIDKTYDIKKFLHKNLTLVDNIYSLTQYRHIILSNATKKQIVDGLIKIGFRKTSRGIHPFELIASREETNVLKPNLEAFEYIHHYTKAAKIRHLVVGDSEKNDLLPARKYGFLTIHRDMAAHIFDFSL